MASLRDSELWQGNAKDLRVKNSLERPFGASQTVPRRRRIDCSISDVLMKEYLSPECRLF